jgi:hypothetical protein
MDKLIIYLSNKTNLNSQDFKEMCMFYTDKVEYNLDLVFLLKVKYPNIILTKEQKQRLFQQKFRNNLINTYSNCIVSKIDDEDELEAAHIVPVSEGGEYNIDNGLLLNRNIHRTFDKYKWSINPNTLIIEIKDAISPNSTIYKYKNKKIDDVNSSTKFIANLKYHYNQFLQN